MTGQELYAKRVKETEWPADDICDPPMDPREAVHILIDHFLGPNWYVAMPESDDQVITVAVCEILDKYPPNKSVAAKTLSIMQILRNYLQQLKLDIKIKFNVQFKKFFKHTY